MFTLDDYTEKSVNFANLIMHQIEKSDIAITIVTTNRFSHAKTTLNCVDILQWYTLIQSTLHIMYQIS